jgi:RNA polymerase sigma-32 factor
MTNSPSPDVSRYITTVHGYAKLSREEELELAREWKATEDPRVGDRLVRAHLRYVVAIALKYRRYGLPLAELIAEGNFGLVHALAKFEPERGNRFVTYAAYWIRAYVLNYIIRSWSLVGVGSGALRSKMFFKLRRERVRITNLVGEGEEADRMLAQRLNLPTEQISSMLRRLESRDVSLDANVFDDSSTRMVDTLVSNDRDSEELASADEVGDLVRDTVRSAVRGLDERERYIVENRLMAEEPKTLQEIGQHFQISRERARQIEGNVIRNIRSALLDSGFDLSAA